MDFPTDHELFSSENKGILGALQCETTSPIKEFIALKCKMYCLVHGEESKKTAKGIKKEQVKRFTADLYKSVLNDKLFLRHQQQNITTKHHSIETVKQNKLSLTPFYDKNFIQDDGEGPEELLMNDEIETAVQNIPQDNLQVNPMPSGSGIQNSLSPNNLQVNPMPSDNLQVNPMPSGSGIQNSYLSPRLHNPYSSSHESFVLIRRLRRLERLKRRRTTRIARAESQATESRDEEVTTSPPPPESQPLRDSRRNSPHGTPDEIHPHGTPDEIHPHGLQTKFTPRDSRRNSPPRDSRRNHPHGLQTKFTPSGLQTKFTTTGLQTKQLSNKMGGRNRTRFPKLWKL
ncbi:uncharacterized protein TNCT_49001 [Trichonephila clavata]|uniref:Uncharacterized protein n=1 Tax=Trichonephila clavata TaxID=2740835 RepID=A0A8X6FFB5_TRICU|nr:uncharacterized protein TNCT_49001 [Trichonephila clavata]